MNVRRSNGKVVITNVKKRNVTNWEYFSDKALSLGKIALRSVAPFAAVGASATAIYFGFFSNIQPSPGFFPPFGPPLPSTPPFPPGLPPFSPPLPSSPPLPLSPPFSPLPPSEPPFPTNLLSLFEIVSLPSDEKYFLTFTDCQTIADILRLRITPYPPEAATTSSKKSLCIQEGSTIVYTSDSESETIPRASVSEYVNTKNDNCKENPQLQKCFFRNENYFSPASPPLDFYFDIVASDETFDSFETASEFCDNHHKGVACPYRADVLNKMYALSHPKQSYYTGFELINGFHVCKSVGGTEYYSSQYSPSLPENYNRALTYRSESITETSVNHTKISFSETGIVNVTESIDAKVFCYTETPQTNIIKGTLSVTCENCLEYCCPIYDGTRYVGKCLSNSVIIDSHTNSQRYCRNETLQEGSLCTNDCFIPKLERQYTDTKYRQRLPSPNNGFCEDEGDYSVYNDLDEFCPFGSDCGDCGPRRSISEKLFEFRQIQNIDPFSEIVITLTNEGFERKGVLISNIKLEKNVKLNILTTKSFELINVFDIKEDSVYSDCIVKDLETEYCQFQWFTDNFVTFTHGDKTFTVSVVTEFLPPPPPCQLKCENTCRKTIHKYKKTIEGFEVNNPTTTSGHDVTNDGVCDTTLTNAKNIHYKAGEYYIIDDDEPCSIGTDCDDCGSECSDDPPEPTFCSNTCATSNDEMCDDQGSQTQDPICVFGTDCQDCGPRYYNCVPFYSFHKHDVTNMVYNPKLLVFYRYDDSDDFEMLSIKDVLTNTRLLAQQLINYIGTVEYGPTTNTSPFINPKPNDFNTPFEFDKNNYYRLILYSYSNARPTSPSTPPSPFLRSISTNLLSTHLFINTIFIVSENYFTIPENFLYLKLQAFENGIELNENFYVSLQTKNGKEYNATKMAKQSSSILENNYILFSFPPIKEKLVKYKFLITPKNEYYDVPDSQVYAGIAFNEISFLDSAFQILPMPPEVCAR